MQFFNSEPYACEPSSLPQYPPSKELDAKLRDEEARRFSSFFLPFFLFPPVCSRCSASDDAVVSCLLHRQRGLGGKGIAGDSTKKARVRDRGTRAVPAPEANAELQINLDVRGTDSLFCL